MATGISESRLRTWERRYGIPHPARSASGRRMYDEEDLVVIRRMAALVAAGVPASEAATAALVERATPAAPEEPTERHPLVETLLRASLAYDESAIVQAVKEAVSELGWARALDEALFPALNRIGESWESGAALPANEHFTSEIMRRELASALGALPLNNGATSSALLACAEDERHDMGLLGLAFLLRQRGLRVIYLGADVPPQDILVAAQQTRVDALCLSAATPSALASLGRAARALVSNRLPVKLFVGGPAFVDASESRSIPGVHLPHRLEDAANLIMDILTNHKPHR